MAVYSVRDGSSDMHDSSKGTTDNVFAKIDNASLKDILQVNMNDDRDIDASYAANIWSDSSRDESRTVDMSAAEDISQMSAADVKRISPLHNDAEVSNCFLPSCDPAKPQTVSELKDVEKLLLTL